MQITFDVDDQLFEQLRADAELRQMSVDELLRDELRQLIEKRSKLAEFVRLTREHAGRSEPGWRFRREECYRGFDEG